MSTARTNTDPAPAGRASAAEPPELDDVLRGTAPGAAATVTVAASGFGVWTSLVAVNTASGSTNETRKKSRNASTEPISDEVSSSHQSTAIRGS